MGYTDFGLRKLIGQRVVHVLLKEGSDLPRSQLFLVLEDGSYLEFYSDGTLRPAGDLREGGLEAARNYMAGRCEITYEI